MGDLARRIKSENPGVYDNLDDDELEIRLVQKHANFEPEVAPEILRKARVRRTISDTAEQSALRRNDIPTTGLQGARMGAESIRENYGLLGEPLLKAAEFGMGAAKFVGGLAYSGAEKIASLPAIAATADSMNDPDMVPSKSIKVRPQPERGIDSTSAATLEKKANELVGFDGEQDQYLRNPRLAINRRTMGALQDTRRKVDDSLQATYFGDSRAQRLASTAGEIAPMAAGVVAAPVAMAGGFAASELAGKAADVASRAIMDDEKWSKAGVDPEYVRGQLVEAAVLGAFPAGAKITSSGQARIKDVLKNYRETRSKPSGIDASRGAADPAVEGPDAIRTGREGFTTSLDDQLRASGVDPYDQAAKIRMEELQSRKGPEGPGIRRGKRSDKSFAEEGLARTMIGGAARMGGYALADAVIPGSGAAFRAGRYILGSEASKRVPGVVGRVMNRLKGKSPEGYTSNQLHAMQMENQAVAAARSAPPPTNVPLGANVTPITPGAVPEAMIPRTPPPVAEGMPPGMTASAAPQVGRMAPETPLAPPPATTQGAQVPYIELPRGTVTQGRPGAVAPVAEAPKAPGFTPEQQAEMGATVKGLTDQQVPLEMAEGLAKKDIIDRYYGGVDPTVAPKPKAPEGPAGAAKEIPVEEQAGKADRFGLTPEETTPVKTGRATLPVVKKKGPKIKLDPVEGSSAISAWGESGGVVEIKRTDGSVYRYYGLKPADVAKAREAIASGESVGRTLGSLTKLAEKSTKHAKSKPKKVEGTPPDQIESKLKESIEVTKPEPKAEVKIPEAIEGMMRKRFNESGYGEAVKSGVSAGLDEATAIKYARTLEDGIASGIPKPGKRKVSNVRTEEVQPGGARGKGLAGEKYPEAERVVPKADRGVDLEELPAAVEVDGKRRVFGSSAKVQKVAEDYAKKAGIEYTRPKKYVKVDEKRASRIAEEYEKMKHDPDNPEVKRAYKALEKETLAQYEEMLKSGLKVEFIEGPDPYGNPRNAIIDVVENNHLWVYPTETGYGPSGYAISKHPMLAPTKHKISGKPANLNDIFRAVHDYFGHIKEGVGFRAAGEENAWRSHSSMYSKEARRAMTAETRGQNSWVNYGPEGAKNRTAKTEGTTFAEQKAGLLPEWVSEEGAFDAPTPKATPKKASTKKSAPKEKNADLDQKADVVAKRGWKVEGSGDKWVIKNSGGKIVGSKATQEAAVTEAMRRSRGQKAVAKPVEVPPKKAATKPAPKAEAPAKQTFKEFVESKGIKFSEFNAKHPQYESLVAEYGRGPGRVQGKKTVGLAERQAAKRVDKVISEAKSADVKTSGPPPPVQAAELREWKGAGHKVGDYVVKDRLRYLVEGVDKDGRITDMVKRSPKPKSLGSAAARDFEKPKKVQPRKYPGRYVTEKKQAENLKREEMLSKGLDMQGRKLKKPAEPQNKVFKDKDGNEWGNVDNDQWFNRVKKNLSPKEMKQARSWYREMRDLIRKHYPDLSENDTAILAFAATQKAASPTMGIMALNRFLEAQEGANRLKPGVSSKALKSVLEDKDIMGFAQKLSDFTDSLFERKGRSWTGTDHLQPAAVDRHAFVDIGFITGPFLRWLQGKGVKGVKGDIPASVGSDAQYLHALKRYNELAKWLNEKNIDGGGWTPLETQAVGWTAVRKIQGLQPESASTVITNNISTVAAEITGFNPRSPVGRAVLASFKKGSAAREMVGGRSSNAIKLSEKITNRIAPVLVDRVAKATNVRVNGGIERSGWGDSRNASIVYDVFGSPEARRDFANAIGRVANQSAVYEFRSLKSGKTQGLVFRANKKLSNDQVGEVWSKAADLEETGSLGQSWIRSTGFSGKQGSVTVLEDSSWSPRDKKAALESIKKYVPMAIRELYGLKATAENARFKLNDYSNNWRTKEAPAGEHYRENYRNSRKGLDEEVEGISQWFYDEVLKVLKEID